MTRMTGPDCAVIMCNSINTHTHTPVSLIPPWEDQCEWHRMTRMTRPDCAVMCNLINTYTHTQRERKQMRERIGRMQGRAGTPLQYNMHIICITVLNRSVFLEPLQRNWNIDHTRCINQAACTGRAGRLIHHVLLLVWSTLVTSILQYFITINIIGKIVTKK